MFGFGKALDVLRDGDAVRRNSWDFEAFSPQSFLMLIPGSEVTVNADRPLGRAMPRLVGEDLTYSSHIDIVCVGADVHVSPWQPTQADLLAEDWDYAR